MFIGLLSAFTTRRFDRSLVSICKGHIKCVSLNNQPCQARPTLTNINSKDPLYYSFIASVNKCDGIYNTTYDPYARVCVPYKVKNINVKIFHLMLRVNETRLLVQHELCDCKCRLN